MLKSRSLFEFTTRTHTYILLLTPLQCSNAAKISEYTLIEISQEKIPLLTPGFEPSTFRLYKLVNEGLEPLGEPLEKSTLNHLKPTLPLLV